MAAALRHDLVFEMNAGHSGGFEDLHGTHHLQGLAEAGVGVTQSRHPHGVGDVGSGARHFLYAQQSDVGVPGSAVDDPGAGYVDRLETQLLRHHRHGGVEAPRHGERTASDGLSQGGDLVSGTGARG